MGSLSSRGPGGSYHASRARGFPMDKLRAHRARHPRWYGPGLRFLSSFLSVPQLSRNPTHGIPRPARPSAQPGLVLSRSPWLPTQPEGGPAAGGATSPRKPHRANNCRGPREARPARSRSHRQTRGGHTLSVCSQRGQSPKVPGHECPPLDSRPRPIEKTSHPGSAWRAGWDPRLLQGQLPAGGLRCSFHC